ncbi:hypothetical protein [Pseudoalteromonas denitrificans]|uniref:Uncharacterized protein n=1 Tax=Pseudoalteromonas denitrificans DSM 6059 TaxID=1123010 RepID=A0A1I1SJJ6_9GAMM|nr:hypothetical protein [Pseudoalteromonas denitrificans]SFD46482.1 hypothetical protein SAMN02745724_04592 [Pseudoalteromonas denitrificans DSM 6059]
MNTSSTGEILTTSVLGGLVMGVLSFNGMGSAVAIGSMIAVSVISATYALARN